MRLLKRALRALILLAGFLAALWAFMPWREVGSFAMALAASRMERQGMTLTYSGVEDVHMLIYVLLLLLQWLAIKTSSR